MRKVISITLFLLMMIAFGTVSNAYEEDDENLYLGIRAGLFAPKEGDLKDNYSFGVQFSYEPNHNHEWTASINRTNLGIKGIPAGAVVIGGDEIESYMATIGFKYKFRDDPSRDPAWYFGTNIVSQRYVGYDSNPGLSILFGHEWGSDIFVELEYMFIKDADAGGGGSIDMGGLLATLGVKTD